MQVLEFIPLYMQRVWGGRGLESKLGRRLPKGQTIGESWEIVDRPNAQSVVASGTFKGHTLRELLQQAAADILGPGRTPAQPFPILVKWLDCQARLSLQVHPPSTIAASLGGEPKTENWYVATASADAHLIVGLKKGVTRAQFERALVDHTVADCVHRFPVKTGDSILVESGRIHAIDAGNLILEIQQNSDTTYRVYDWERVGLDGRPRRLHVENSLKSIHFNDFEPAPLPMIAGEQVLAECDAFRIRKFALQPGDTALHLPGAEQARLIHLISGSVRDDLSGQILHSGCNYLQPYVTHTRLIAKTPAVILLTDQF